MLETSQLCDEYKVIFETLSRVGVLMTVSAFEFLWETELISVKNE